jgi:hypothetical protein
MIMQRTFIAIIALITGLLFFAGSTATFATASTPVASKKQKSKKLHANKKKG